MPLHIYVYPSTSSTILGKAAPTEKGCTYRVYEDDQLDVDSREVESPIFRSSFLRVRRPCPVGQRARCFQKGGAAIVATRVGSTAFEVGNIPY